MSQSIDTSEVCGTCGHGPCPTPQACLKSDEPPTRRDLASFWGGTLAAVAVLIALAVEFFA